MFNFLLPSKEVIAIDPNTQKIVAIDYNRLRVRNLDHTQPEIGEILKSELPEIIKMAKSKATPFMWLVDEWIYISTNNRLAMLSKELVLHYVEEDNTTNLYISAIGLDYSYKIRDKDNFISYLNSYIARNGITPPGVLNFNREAKKTDVKTKEHPLLRKAA